LTEQSEQQDEIPENIRETFLGMLLHDVILSLERMEQDDCQATRRDLIRTTFAAIEGVAQVYRDHVRSIADNLDLVDQMTAMALSEIGYFVSETGKLERQIRFIPLPSMIRLITRLAKQVCPQVKVDFSGADWQNFRLAIAIRNRITHPKTRTDLTVPTTDVKVVQGAFFWLLEVVSNVMSATNTEASRYLALLTEFGEKLISGDENAKALYEAVKRELDE
jgi:hypothetical protein